MSSSIRGNCLWMDYVSMFSEPQVSSYIDITVVGQNVLGMVERWFIPEYDSLSDYRRFLLC